jgi:hypothetical protein
MKVTDFSKYRGKRALVLIGTDDVDHPRELDMRIADWLNENGASWRPATRCRGFTTYESSQRPAA